MKSHRYPLLAVTLVFVLMAAGGGRADTIAVSKAAKCPVCGMFVSLYPEWLARIEFSDQTAVTFDGPKDMFKYYLNPDRYQAEHGVDDITAIHVTDYYSVEAIDARKAWYVLGSDVYGPMGAELIPFSSKSDAAAFVKDHAGTEILSFKKVDSALMDRID